MEIGSREAVWLTVARGIGISVVSDIEFIPHPDIQMIEIADADIFSTVQLNCLRERKHSRRVKAFLRCARGITSSSTETSKVDSAI